MNVALGEQLDDLDRSAHHPTADDAPALREELDVARGKLRHLSDQVTHLEERLTEAETRVASHRREAELARAMVAELQGTLSWRITVPLRAARRLLGRS